MKTIDTSITIQRPIEEVFTAVTNFDRFADWRAGLIEAAVTSDGPMQAGATYRFNSKVMGRVIETTGQVEAYEPPGFFAWKATSGPFPTRTGTPGESSCAGTVLRGSRQFP